jgi:hypothetical protein
MMTHNDNNNNEFRPKDVVAGPPAISIFRSFTIDALQFITERITIQSTGLITRRRHASPAKAQRTVRLPGSVHEKKKMATDVQAPQPAAQSQLPREAAAIEADLQRLEDLSEQLERLRNALPMMVEPMIRVGLSDAQRIEKLRGACVQASEGVTSLRKGMTDDQTQSIFKSTSESLEKDGDLSRARDVPFYGYNDAK